MHKKTCELNPTARRTLLAGLSFPQPTVPCAASCEWNSCLLCLLQDSGSHTTSCGGVWTRSSGPRCSPPPCAQCLALPTSAGEKEYLTDVQRHSVPSSDTSGCPRDTLEVSFSSRSGAAITPTATKLLIVPSLWKLMLSNCNYPDYNRIFSLLFYSLVNHFYTKS